MRLCREERMIKGRMEAPQLETGNRIPAVCIV